MILFKLVCLYQLRSGYLLYSLTAFSVDFVLHKVDPKIPTASLLILFLFIPKFINPIRSLELNNTFIQLADRIKGKLLCIHNASILMWFGIGFIASSFVLPFFNGYLSFTRLLLPFAILLIGILVGNLLHYLFTQKRFSYFFFQKVLFLTIVTFISLVPIAAWYFDSVGYLVLSIAVFSLLLLIQLKIYVNTYD